MDRERESSMRGTTALSEIQKQPRRDNFQMGSLHHSNRSHRFRRVSVNLALKV